MGIRIRLGRGDEVVRLIVSAERYDYLGGVKRLGKRRRLPARGAAGLLWDVTAAQPLNSGSEETFFGERCEPDDLFWRVFELYFGAYWRPEK